MKLFTNLALALLCGVTLGYTFHGTSLCNDPRCVCLQTSYGLGMNVSCRCTPQDPEALLDIVNQTLPETTGLLSIQGCRDIHVSTGALYRKPYLTDVLINDAGRIAFQPYSGSDIAASKTPGIHIRRCRELRIHTAAFANNLRSPFSLEISHCQIVHLNESPFSRVRSIAISHVNKLHLSSNSFRLQHFQSANTIERYAGEQQLKEDSKADIRIAHSRIVSGIPNSCFPSPLRRLELTNITTEEIASNAFLGLETENVLISDSEIGEIAEEAFQERVLLDSFEIRNSKIDAIRRRGLGCAATSFVLQKNSIGTIESLGVSMHAAKNSIRNNNITIVKNGAFHMKSWNDLEIWNNTMDVVEKNAFINIGQPDVSAFDDRSVQIRFAVKENTVKNAQVGAFVFSAQAMMLSLENNFFWRHCDCDLNKWSADLTQAVRSTDVAEVGSLRAQNTTETAALWIGSALFNNSFCKIALAESQCFALSDTFLPMIRYTQNYCPKTRAAVECISRVNSKSESTESSTVLAETNDVELNQPQVKKLDNSVLLVIIFTVGLTVLILIAVISILLVKRRHQGKRRQSDSRDSEGLVTCAPLLSVHDEAGAMRSGSISKLSITDYKTSLLPPPESEQQTMSLASQATDTTEVEDHTIERTKDELYDTKTIDRGIQTDTQPMNTITEDFAEAVLAAIRDKLEVSPTYSEVRDKLFNKRESIGVTLGSPSGGGDLYTKPWLSDYDTNKEPIYSSILPKVTPTTIAETSDKSDSLTKAGLPPVQIDLTKQTAEEILNSLKSPENEAPSSISSESSLGSKKGKKDQDSSASDNDKKGPRKTWVLQEPSSKAKSPTRATSPKWPPPGYDATLKPNETAKPPSRKTSAALSPTRALTSPSAVKNAASPPPKKDSRLAWRNGGSSSLSTPLKKISKEDTPVVDSSTFTRKSSLKESDSPSQSERRRSVRFSPEEASPVAAVVSDYQSPSDAIGVKSRSEEKKDADSGKPFQRPSLNIGEYSLPRDQIPSRQSLTYSEVSREVPLTQRPLPKRPDLDEPATSSTPSPETENFYEQLTR